MISTSESIFIYHLYNLQNQQKMTPFMQGNVGPYEVIHWVEQPKVAIGKECPDFMTVASYRRNSLPYTHPRRSMP